MAPNEKSLIEFLTQLFGDNLSYSAINTAKSAVCSVNIMSNIALGKHPSVIRFMKGVFNLRPNLPKNTCIWDINQLLDWVRKKSPVKFLSLKDLTFKLTALIAILSGQRAQTMNLIKLENIVKTKDGLVINITEKVKQSKPGKHVKPISLGSYPPDRRVCVVTVYKEYLKRTKLLRKDSNSLLISYIKPYKEVNVSTISRWLRTIMVQAGIDMNMFTPGTTRSASVSAAHRAQVPLNTILKTGGWFVHNTFNKFYNKDIVDINKYSKAILQNS